MREKVTFSPREKVEKVTRVDLPARAQLDRNRKPTKKNFENRTVNKVCRAGTDIQIYRYTTYREKMSKYANLPKA
jgi:hypothetical protein